MTECGSRSWGYRALKRGMDLALGIPLGIVTLPLMLALLGVVALRDHGAPLYFQERVGKDGEAIRIAKLRSMRLHSDELERALTPEQLRSYRREFKLPNDPRLIGYAEGRDASKCFGAILRKYALDELPQILYNVCLKGNLSLVGPRPILREELEAFYTPEQRRAFLSVKPGLTGYWKAYAPHWRATYQNGRRQEMELYYVAHQSAWMDVKIMFATLRMLICSDSADSGRSAEERER